MKPKPRIAKCRGRWRVTVGNSSLIFGRLADAITYVEKLNIVREHVLQ